MLPSAKDSLLDSRHDPKKDSTSYQNHQIQTLSARASDVCASITLFTRVVSFSCSDPEVMICRACLRARAGATRVATSRNLRVQPLSSLSAVRVPQQRTLPPIGASCRTSIATTLSRSFSSTPKGRQEASSAATPAPKLEKPENLSEGEQQIWDRLVAELSPEQLVVQDISGGCGSMYYIDVSCEGFRGLNMLKQQRMVNAALGDMVKQWHGVQIKTRAP